MLDDVIAPGLRLVICGSAVGTASARAGCYYAGPQNRFWQTLFEVGLTPRPLAPHEFRTLLEFGIGVTDIVKTQVGPDHVLRPAESDVEVLRSLIERYRPRMLCFNGKRAAQQFLGRTDVALGLQSEMVGATRLFVAPSTSAAARRYWRLEVWQALADEVARLSPGDGALATAGASR